MHISVLFLVAVGVTFVFTDQQPSALVSHDEIAVHPSPEITGEHKIELNHLKQTGLISEFKWVDDHRRDPSGKSCFMSSLEVTFVDGHSLCTTSKLYYSTKQAAHEVAAKNAINVIRKQPTTSSQPLVYKRDLNNLLTGFYHDELPTYRTSQVREHLFQCTVSHPLIKKAADGVDSITCTGSSIKEAENRAASSALDLLYKK